MVNRKHMLEAFQASRQTDRDLETDGQSGNNPGGAAGGPFAPEVDEEEDDDGSGWEAEIDPEEFRAVVAEALAAEKRRWGVAIALLCLMAFLVGRFTAPTGVAAEEEDPALAHGGHGEVLDGPGTPGGDPRRGPDWLTGDPREARGQGGGQGEVPESRVREDPPPEPVLSLRDKFLSPVNSHTIQVATYPNSESGLAKAWALAEYFGPLGIEATVEPVSEKFALVFAGVAQNMDDPDLRALLARIQRLPGPPPAARDSRPFATALITPIDRYFRDAR